MKKMAPRRTGGFTLIEIIIVVVIMGILAAVALPKLTDNINRARAAEAFQMGGTVAKAFGRCLEASSGGTLIATTDIDNCTDAAAATQWALLGIVPPPTTNFTWTFPNGNINAVTTPLVMLATSVQAAGSTIQFSVQADTGATIKACAGVFTSLCK